MIRLGTFHTICNLLSIIGKRFQDAGLRDLCVEAGIMAEGSVSSALEGKRYNRAVRVHKCVYETLNRLIWHQFEPWVASNHPTMSSVVSTLQESITDLTAGLNQQKHDEVLNSQALKQVYELWTLFLDFLRCNNGQLSAFWMSYIQLVEVLFALIRASREGNWHLHPTLFVR